MSYSLRPPSNFLALPPEHSDFENSRVLLLPVPYDGTTSYKGGTKEGPGAIIEASAQVELYDREFGCEAALEYGIHTLSALEPNLSGPEATVNEIEAAVADLAGTGKLLGLIGGEHSISIGMARGLRQVHGDFVTVQLDAHADLRDEYEGTPYSHACAARRIQEFSHVIQLGIRSVDMTEAEFIRENPDRVTTYFAEEMQGDSSYLESVAEAVARKNVYLTVDIDALDPSIIPATGTPEPGGLLWYQTLEILRRVTASGNVIGFDCVELLPLQGLHHPQFTTAKLIYKMINSVMRREIS